MLNSSKTASPIQYPAPTSTKFQIKIPAAELMLYERKSILITPAGKPGRFRYSKSTVRKIKIAPYYIKNELMFEYPF